MTYSMILLESINRNFWWISLLAILIFLYCLIYVCYQIGKRKGRRQLFNQVISEISTEDWSGDERARFRTKIRESLK